MASQRLFKKAVARAVAKDESMRWLEPKMKTGMLEKGKMRTGLSGPGPTTTAFMRGTHKTSVAESIKNAILYS